MRRAVLPGSGRRECGRRSKAPAVPRAQKVPGAVACTDCLEFLGDPQTWTTTPTGETVQCSWCGSLAPRSSVLSAVACQRAACRCGDTRSPARGELFHGILFKCTAIRLDGKPCSEGYCHTCIVENLGETELDAMNAEDAPPNSWVRAFEAASRLACVHSPGGFSRGRMCLWRRKDRAAVFAATRCSYPTQPLFSGVCGSRYSTTTAATSPCRLLAWYLVT